QLPANGLTEEPHKCFPIFPFARWNQGAVRNLVPREREARKAKPLGGWPVAIVFPVLEGEVGAFDAHLTHPREVILAHLSALLTVGTGFLYFERDGNLLGLV